VVDKPVSKTVAAKPVKPVVTKAAHVAAKPVAAKPTVSAKPVAVKPVPAAPVAVVKPAPVVTAPVAEQIAAAPVVIKTVETPVAAPVAKTNIEGKKLMNDTINKAQEAAKNFAEQATERTTAAFGDMNVRAKDAMAKGTKAIEELVEFSKGNFEAMVASSKVAAKGAEEIAKYSADYGRKSIEGANATAKKFAGVKSPTEFFQLQSEVAKSSLDAMVAEGSKFTESYLKLLGEIAQPIQNRVSVAVEKVKTTVAA
jgi:phasin family protein